MVSRSKKLKSRMKSGASASTQRSASRPMVGSASMSMRMGSSHLCSRHLLTLSQAHSVSALCLRGVVWAVCCMVLYSCMLIQRCMALYGCMAPGGRRDDA